MLNFIIFLFLLIVLAYLETYLKKTNKLKLHRVVYVFLVILIVAFTLLIFFYLFKVFLLLIVPNFILFWNFLKSNPSAVISILALVISFATFLTNYNFDDKIIINPFFQNTKEKLYVNLVNNSNKNVEIIRVYANDGVIDKKYLLQKGGTICLSFDYEIIRVSDDITSFSVVVKYQLFKIIKREKIIKTHGSIFIK